jgi:uncharacterized metal-binding protein
LSNGKVHDALTKDIQIPISVIGGSIALYATHDILKSGAVFITLLIGTELQRIMTPDLDIIANKKYKYGYYPLYMIYQTLGYIPYILWKIYWYPYGLLPHRTWISHGFIIGGLFRLVYLFGPSLVLLYILYPNLIPILDILHSIYLILFIIGFLLADTGHLVLDYIPPVRNLYENYLGEAYQWHK